MKVLLDNVCNHCQTAYTVSVEDTENIGLEDLKCPKCGKTNKEDKNV